MEHAMSRFATLIIAPLMLSAAFASPATSATYSAKPAIQPETSRMITGDITWRCGPDACLGSSEGSRPAVLCQGLAKRAGQLISFVADGRAFGAAELTKCNRSAKGSPASRTTPTAIADAN